ncbi:hypothetical protein IVA86_04550 [Bradyrhizobium sp. 146]|uniref:hypothetical protein n=1 Tax=Bradyrhizobium sp. 146 TaxID=2782622 RepID=UPI001FFAE8EE|nr:hypothetical protein [Bradyrhizobium sp. 146]MCK1700719.1 hypothetical protein [Bradyrhizobium sp. 146]
MKRLIGLVALLITTGAFAQTAPPKPAKKPPIHVKPQPPMGCKLIGAVKGTKIWAGDCIAPSPAAEIPAPASPPTEPGDERPKDTKP